MIVIKKMLSHLIQKRLKVHKNVLYRFSKVINSISVFFIIFSFLLILFNWSAYFRIFRDFFPSSILLQKETDIIIPSSFERIHKQPSALFHISSLGEISPDDMRLMVPKVFEGSIPIRSVSLKNFNFKDLYASENKIQEALREGVVHYPFTADPNQYGNVFITGHSSYYPWDKGRYKDIFALLHKLELGDKYFIFFQGKKYTYQVTEKYEVEPDDVSVLAQPDDKKISTLMTCTPVGTVLRRLIVQADLININ